MNYRIKFENFLGVHLHKVGVAMSYGYEPPKHEPSGTWSEMFLMTKIMFSLLIPIIGSLLGVLLLAVTTFFLFAAHFFLGLLVPIGTFIGIAYFFLRGRQKYSEELARISSD